jgi:hypothetical protein
MMLFTIYGAGAGRGVLFDVIQICPPVLDGEMNALLAAPHTFAHLMRFSPTTSAGEQPFAKHFSRGSTLPYLSTPAAFNN